MSSTRYAWYKPAFKFVAYCALVSGSTVLKAVPNENCKGQGEFLAWYKNIGFGQYYCALVVKINEHFWPIEKRPDSDCLNTKIRIDLN